MNSLSDEQLRQLLENDSKPFLLDVREPEELEDGRIAGSVNIPMREVEGRLQELPIDRDIVVICHLGQRSEYIARKLGALGYDRVFNLAGGMEAWLARPKPAG